MLYTIKSHRLTLGSSESNKWDLIVFPPPGSMSQLGLNELDGRNRVSQLGLISTDEIKSHSTTGIHVVNWDLKI